MNTNLKKSIKTLAIALMVTTLLIPGAAFAFEKGHGQGMGMGRSGHGFNGHKGMGSPYGFWKNQQIVTAVGLTNEQVNQLKNADFDFRESCLQIRNQITELNLKMEKAMSETTVKDSNVIKIAKDISNLRGQLYVKQIEAKLNVKKMLTDEQFQKLETNRKQMFSRNRMHRSQGCRFGNGPQPMNTTAQ